jgi:hypothetical protein
MPQAPLMPQTPLYTAAVLPDALPALPPTRAPAATAR